MSQPLVSVVLCTYNGAAYLQEQVDSILGQTWKNLELIISDDNSTDGTIELLKKYEGKSAVKIFLQKENLGLTRNFEFAASQASGVFVAFSDQDDIWIPEKIERLVNAIGNFPLVYSDSVLVDGQNKPIGKKLSDLKRMYSGDDSRGYFLYSCVWGHGMMVTKNLLRDALPMPQGVHHDIWIAYLAFQHGGIHYLDEVLTRYRQHSSSTSQTLPERNSVRKRDDRLTAYQKKLHWLSIMQEYEREAYQPFFKRLLTLYTMKQYRGYVWPLVFFMLKERKAIFKLSKKGTASQLVEIMKQGRGVQ